MTLQQLRYLIAVAEYGSINKAAASLYASQSNLSTAINGSWSESWASLFSPATIAVFPSPTMVPN